MSIHANLSPEAQARLNFQQRNLTISSLVSVEINHSDFPLPSAYKPDTPLPSLPKGKAGLAQLVEQLICNQ